MRGCAGARVGKANNEISKIKTNKKIKNKIKSLSTQGHHSHPRTRASPLSVLVFTFCIRIITINANIFIFYYIEMLTQNTKV